MYLFANPTQLKYLSQFVQEHYQDRIAIKQNDVFLDGDDADLTCVTAVYKLTGAGKATDPPNDNTPMPRVGTSGILP